MAYLIVQHATIQAAAASTTLTLPRPVVAGNCLIAWVVCVQPSPTQSVSDNLNGVWSEETTDFLGTTSAAIWQFTNTHSGSTTITVSATSSTSIVLMAAEVGGVVTSAPVDATSSNSYIMPPGTPANPNTGSLVVSSALEFMFGGMWIDNAAGSTGPGFTQIDNIGGRYITEWGVTPGSGIQDIFFANSAPGTGTAMVHGVTFFPGPTGGILTHTSLLTVGVGR